MNLNSELTQAQRSLMWKRKDEPRKSKPFDLTRALDVVRQIRPARTLDHSSSLPPCPLCASPAFAAPYKRATDLTHDCGCCDTQRSEYDAALIRLWQQEHALENYLMHVPERFRGVNLRDIAATPGKRRALEVAKGSLQGQFVYLYGDGGVGKSELAAAIGMRAARAKLLARWWSAVDWAEAVRVGASTGTKPALRHWDVLVLDDLDKFKPSDWMFQEVYAVLEYRVANPRCTVITANHDPVTAARRLCTVDGKTDFENASALASRLGSGYVIQVTGEDNRFRAAERVLDKAAPTGPVRALFSDTARVPAAD